MPTPSGYHSRGYLPHVKVDGAAYFVTFRLADTLPREIVAQLNERRNDLRRRIATAGASPDEERRQQFFHWYLAEVDGVLDRSADNTWLAQPKIAGLVAGALQYSDGIHYNLKAWSVMPNHVHVVVRPLGSRTLSGILQRWKSYTAHVAKRLLGPGVGHFWQPESYDHWIRDDEELAHCCHYTEQNPVKAGLCGKAEDWAWSSAAKKK